MTSFKKFSSTGLNFCKFSSVESSSTKEDKFVDTFPNSLKVAEFFNIFSIVEFDFVPSFRLVKSSFKIVLAEVEEVELFTICSKFFESASFSTSFKTLLLFGNSIFNKLPFETNIMMSIT